MGGHGGRVLLGCGGSAQRRPHATPPAVALDGRPSARRLPCISCGAGGCRPVHASRRQPLHGYDAATCSDGGGAAVGSTRRRKVRGAARVIARTQSLGRRGAAGGCRLVRSRPSPQEPRGMPMHAWSNPAPDHSRSSARRRLSGPPTSGQAIRSLCASPSPLLRLRFVMADDERHHPDAKRGDIKYFKISRRDRRLRAQFLLKNAWLRYATSGARRTVPFVGKADDDSFYDAQTIGEPRMRAPTSSPISSHTHACTCTTQEPSLSLSSPHAHSAAARVASTCAACLTAPRLRLGAGLVPMGASLDDAPVLGVSHSLSNPRACYGRANRSSAQLRLAYVPHTRVTV